MAPLLEIRDLKIEFETEEGGITAIDGVDLHVDEGDTLGLVGESGCGKSVTCHSILQLTPPNGRVVSGEILFAGVDLLTMNESAMGKVRGRDIAMIFQDPLTSLNPVHQIGRQLTESLMLHQRMSHDEANRESRALLDRVGIPDSDRRIKEYPHQLSGGMNQRVMIAMALACRPKLIIADEPTTALDVTIQAQILDLLRELKDDIGMAVMLVTHDLGVVAEMANSVAVMYLGRVVEEGPVEQIFESAVHPYTHGLMQSIPRVDLNVPRLTPITGSVPPPLDLPSGCHFRTRCPNVLDRCSVAPPPLEALDAGHAAACYNPVKAL